MLVATSEWLIGQLRATTFIDNTNTNYAIKNTWWHETIDKNPEEEHIDHKHNSKEQIGPLGNNKLVLISQSDRVDWVLETITNESPVPVSSPMTNHTLEPFLMTVKNWFSRCPPAKRLAFGAILVRPTASIQTGYEEIQPYLTNVKMYPQDTTNFFYQINRPKQSKVNPDITINRLNKWSVRVRGDNVPESATTICMLELDINTTPLYKTVTGSDADDIFSELVEQGRDIASRGDR